MNTHHLKLTTTEKLTVELRAESDADWLDESVQGFKDIPVMLTEAQVKRALSHHGASFDDYQADLFNPGTLYRARHLFEWLGY
ncbi:MAG: hypothetical protein CMF69_01115 [Magnetovibrio sp.]|nr:hypothetical protein [Magnetovibrio sp.]|tara:strand:+ start:488 stop:736 length:249 start_codon:yes stop_codon:yes gene_type:complete